MTYFFRPHLWFAARWLPMVTKRKPIEQLLQDATPNLAYTPYRGIQAEQVIAAVRATTARPWRMRARRCLREGLLGFRFLRLAGFAPVLHFGAGLDADGQAAFAAISGLVLHSPTINLSVGPDPNTLASEIIFSALQSARLRETP